MPTLEPFCEITATLTPQMLGNMPGGTRIDFPFEGVAVSTHWDGERPVKGIDHVTVRSDGNMDLDLHATIGTGRETVAYHAVGVVKGVSRSEGIPQELITFQTGNDDLAWLNASVAVGMGKTVDTDLQLSVYIVRAD